MKLQPLFAVAVLAAAGAAIANPAPTATKAAPAKTAEAKPAAASHEAKTMARDESALRHERWLAAQDIPNPKTDLHAAARQQRMDKAIADWRAEQG